MPKTYMDRRAWLLNSAAGFGTLLPAARQLFTQQPDVLQKGLPALLPWPQSVKFGGRKFPLMSGGRLRVFIVVDKATKNAGSRAAALIADEIKRRTQQMAKTSGEPEEHGYPIKLYGFSRSRLGNETEVEGGYRLSVTSEGALLEGNEAGLAYAAATLNQLMEGQQAVQLPEVEIHDWPEFRWRGIYNEVPSVAGMSLEDWKDFILFAASLKLNAINVGLYGCWQRPPSLQLDSEFFLFPSRQYPQFRTPIRSVRFSKKQGRAVIQQALPAIYTEDFFGDVVAFGKENGVEVSPSFESLGHNTLIPRLMPEVSMKDANCKPIGYGFCTTCPKTYEVLFALYDEIISRYARPYGVTTFNVGMDEVARACQCPSCREAWNGIDDFYVNHLIKIVSYLKKKGMKRVIVWHDTLHRTGLLNKHLLSRLEKEGLIGLITVAWWYYDKPFYKDSLAPQNSFGKAFFLPKTPLKAWATPSAGWDTVRPLGASFRTQREALYSLLLLGKQRGAEGSLSYSIHDPVFTEGYVNFSQYSWNQAPSLEETARRYSVWLCGKDDDRWAASMQRYEAAYNVYSGLIDTFYSRARVVTTGDALALLSPSASRESSFETALKDLALASNSLEALQRENPDAARSALVRLYWIEVRRLATFLGAGYAALKCNAVYDGFRTRRDPASLAALSKATDYLIHALKGYAQCLEEQEQICYPASLPRFLAYEARGYEGFQQLAGLFGELVARGSKGETDYLPEVLVAREELFGTDVGMTVPE